MPYASTHLLFRLLGTFGPTSSDNSEFWSMGLRIQIGATGHTESAKSAFLAAVATPTSTFYTSTNLKAHGASYLTTLTAAYIGTDGRYEGGESQPTTKYNYPTAFKGDGLATYPYSQAQVITLRSDIQRGRGKYGRIYLPSAHPVDSTGKFIASGLPFMLTEIKTWVDAVNTAARTAWTPASAVSVFSNLGTGTTGTVVDVGLGRQPDTQRRRDNRLKEEHIFTSLATTQAVKAQIQEQDYTSSVEVG